MARYDVLDDNGDVLESSESWTLAVLRAKEHRFRVRDNTPDSQEAPMIAWAPPESD